MSFFTDLLLGSPHGKLPFEDPLTAAKLFLAVLVLLLIYAVIRAVISSRSMTIRRAHFAVACSFIANSLANIFVCTFLFWYLALPLCIVITVIYMLATANEVHEANSEERSGVWGLNRDIRRVRSEIFSDMTQEEQIEYRKNVREFNFNKPLYMLISMTVPLLFILICTFFDTGYKFVMPMFS